MKKIILPLLTLIFALSANQALAINFDKIANAVDSATADSGDKKNSNPLDKMTNKMEERVNKVFERIEGRVEKYEKKFDEVEKKIDKAEQATDHIINTLNSFDKSQIEKYVKIAKCVAIGVAAVFVTLILLLILVFVQLTRVRKLLKNSGK